MAGNSPTKENATSTGAASKPSTASTVAADDARSSAQVPTLAVPDVKKSNSEDGASERLGDTTEVSTLNIPDDIVKNNGDAASERTAAPTDEKKTTAKADDDADKASLKAASIKEKRGKDDTDAAAAAAEEEGQYPSGFKQAFLVSAVMAGVFLIALDQTIVGTAIPKITNEFGGLSDVAWYGSAYFMTFGAGQPSAGKLYQFFNLKWCFLMSLFIFEIGSLICGVAPNSRTLIVGRAIAGLGGAGTSVGGTSILTLSVPPARRPMMMGLVGTTYAVAAALGPILGGVFSDSVSWRWCFYINLPIGGAAAFAILLFFSLPSAAKPKEASWVETIKHTDLVGFALAMGAITSYVLALQYAGITHPWSSSVVIGLIIGFVAISAALVVWEIYMGEYAAMQARLYKQRHVWASAAFQFFFMGAYVVLLYYLPIFFQSILGSSPIDSGVKNLPLMIPASVFAIAGGITVMVTGHAMLVMMISSALTTVSIGLIYTWGLNTPQGQWVGYQFFTGVVMAFGIMHGVTVAQAGIAAEDLSAVTAIALFFQTIGGAFSTAAGQSAFANRLFAALPTTAPGVPPEAVFAVGAANLRSVFPPEVLPGILTAYLDGVKASFAVAVAFSGVAFLFSFALPWGKLPTHKNGDAPAMAMA